MRGIIFFILFYWQSVIAQNDTIFIPELGGAYIGALNMNGMPNGNGELIILTGGSYTGEWDKGLYHGKGIRIWHDGSKYEGSWKKGRRDGFGKMIYISKEYTLYKGQWKNNLFHGEGMIEYSNGNIYNGEFKKNQKNGYGTMYWVQKFSDPIVHRGNWKKGLMHGKGRIEGFVSGRIWKGRWERNIRKKGKLIIFIVPHEDKYMTE